MTSESSAGRNGRGPDSGSEVGLRRLLEANRIADAPTAQFRTQPQAGAPRPDVDPPTTALPRPAVAPSAGGEWPGDSTPTEPLSTNSAPVQPPTDTAPVQAPRPPAAPSGPLGRQQRPGGKGPGGRGPGGKGPRGGKPGAPPWWKTPDGKRAGLIAGAVIAVAGLAYLTDTVMSAGEVPRGVVVAGVDIGGMDVDAADAKLRGALDGRDAEEVALHLGDVRDSMVPAAAGLGVDWDETWDRIGGQPLNPLTRFISLFGTREVRVASTVDDAALDRQLDALQTHDRPTVEGAIRFDNGSPVAVPPATGRVMDRPVARTVLIEHWMDGDSLILPVVPAPVAVTTEAVDRALREIAQPAVSADIVFKGKGRDAVLTPAQIATVLSFASDGQGGLAVHYDQNAAMAALEPQLKESEVEPKDATFEMSGGTPTIVPAVIGDKVDWPKTLEQLPALLVATQRSAPAVYGKVDPKLTTEGAEKLGIIEPMGEFTTGGFSGPSGVNIATVAAKVNGAIVPPGETFSLNGFTGHRGVAEGYVESGIIDHGRPSTAVGGGISQFATTLYNAAYFAGLEDAGHTEHSYYISRYPAAREATVFDGAIDLQFRNNAETGVYIEAFTTSSQVTVRLWGTKTVDVESVTGERTKPTEPQTITLPEGDDCITTEGAPGFTITDTRIITDRATGEQISRNTRTVKYDPIPVVKCEPKDKKDEPGEPGDSDE